MDYSQWQHAFTQSLLGTLNKELSDTFSSKHKQQRFAVYQNNVFHSLGNALADLYPTVKKLVGEDFFTATAGIYLREHPPSQAAMVHFGQDFPQFLRSFEHTQTMPFLADTAALEVARQLAYHAADETALTGAEVSRFTPQELENASLILHSSVQMLYSDYTIFSIWQDNQEKSLSQTKETIDINEPQWLLIVRPEYELNMFSVDEGTYLFFEALRQQSSVSAALTTALGCDGFDPSSAISLAVQHGFLAHIIINSGE